MVVLKGSLELKKMFISVVLLVGLLYLTQAHANAQDLYLGVPVSDVGTTGNTIMQANTSRCLSVAPDGTIYAVYHGTNGIRVAKSINRGASFSPSVLVRTGNYEAEIAVSSTGIVYVTWVQNGNALVSTSSNGGVSFSEPVTAGTAGASVHMAVDGNYVYLIERNGNQFYYSSNCGQSFAKKIFNETYVFSDVHVNSLTGQVIVQKDNPQIIYYISQDHGQTFGAKKTPAASINYSVGSVSTGTLGTYLFVGGYSTMSTRINLADGIAKTLAFGNTTAAQGRSLSVDGFGNVVTGFVNGGNVNYAVSQNLGDTFGTTHTVAAASMANAAINTTNGDVMFLYESGGKIYLSVFEDELKGYSLEASTTNLNFANQEVGTESSEKIITVTNKGTTAITVKKIDITGSDFLVSHNIGSVLDAGQSYTINVNFAPTMTNACLGLISILTDVSTEPRTIQLSGTGVDTTPPTTTVQVSGVKGTNDFYIGNVTVTFNAEDTYFGQDGIAKTEYSLNNGQSWIQSNGTAVFSNSGNYELLYRSVDLTNNVEATKKVEFKIDQSAPTAVIEYSTTNPTNMDVSVKMIANEAVAITNNNGADAYTFTENGTFTFEFVDEAGNVGTAIATVANIDKKLPTASILYDTTSFTKEAVVATLQPSEPVTIINNAGANTYTFETNGTFTFEFKDIVGNIGTETATVNNIDKTLPVIQYEIQPAPASNGWNNTDVVVHFTASDDLSGIEFVTPDILVSTDGANQEFSGKAIDKAGNEIEINVENINIDQISPTIIGETTTAPNSNAWYKEDVTVKFTASDELSGVDTVSPEVIITTEGANQSVTGIAADKAGNLQDTEVKGINIDKTAPTLTYTVTPVANSNGWQNNDVVVHFEAVDTLSGVDVVTSDVTISMEGKNQIVVGKAIDKAGNEVEVTVTLNIDKTAPAIIGAATKSPNANGWYNTDVTVTYTATDELSGIATVSPDVVISSEGADQAVTGTATDKSGNSMSKTVIGIKIDKTAPVISVSIADGAVFAPQQVVVINWSAMDALSMIETTTSPYSDGETIDTTIPGINTITITAIDKAGNITTKTITYYVRYTFIGVLSPLNQSGTNPMKLGRTIPVKFQLKDANSNYINTATAQLILIKPDGTEINAQSSGNSNSDNSFRFDPSEKQYIYNWSTKGLTTGVWTLKIVLEDGTIHFVTVTLI